MQNFTIVLENKGYFYKISKIIPQGDGSFSVSVPYCKEGEGCVVKAYADYNLHDFKIGEDEMIQKFSINENVKVSMHTSGFVQFSGNGITSGIDSATGKIKGMGLFTSPLDKPIESGPTIGTLVWGLKSGFVQCGEHEKNALLFREHDCYFRFASEENYNTHLIEIFVLPGYLKYQVQTSSTGLNMYKQFFQYREQPGAIFKLRIVYLNNISSFLGILISKTNTQFPEDSSYGFELSTPAGPKEFKNGKWVRPGMWALFPALYIEGSSLPSLKRG